MTMTQHHTSSHRQTPGSGRDDHPARELQQAEPKGSVPGAAESSDARPVHVALPAGPAALHELVKRSLPSSGNAIALHFADGSAAPPALATWASCCWNAHALIVLFEGRFTALRFAPEGTPRDANTGKTQKLWDLSDVFEFFIVPDANTLSVYREFQVSPDARWFDAAISGSGDLRRSDTGWDSHATFVSETESDSVNTWRAGMAIPWTSLGLVPRAGLTMPANFYRATGRFHGDELLAWSPTGYGDHAFHRTNTYGLLKLG